MKKCLLLISAYCGSRLNWLPVLAGLLMIFSLGCKSDPRQHSVGLDDFATGGVLSEGFFSQTVPHQAVELDGSSIQQRHQTAKPTLQDPKQSNGPANRRVARYPAQQGTYQYPATNPPGQRPSRPLRTAALQTGFQSGVQSPVLPGQVPALGAQPFQLAAPQFQAPFQVPQVQAPQIQLPAQPFQIQQPALQPALGQPNVAQPFQVPQAQPGQVPQVQPGFFPNQNLNGQGLFPSVQQPEFLDLDVFIPQNPSGRISIGGTLSSDNSLIGQLVLEEHDFDIRAWPRTLRDAFGPRAWRGGGQRFRAEAVPGADLERYLVSWSDPYFRGTETSLSLSAYLFERQYFDYDEKRVGGRVSIGRRLSEYLSFSAGLRYEDVTIDNPRVGTSPQLNAVLGDSDLFLGSVGLVYDNRVLPYLTGLGTYLGLTFTQAFGDFDYSRGELEFRNHQKVFARPDDSGRHVIGFRSVLGFTGGSTPVFENFFAGGLSSLRGFDFRGVSPLDGGVRVGGEFQWVNSLEYTFPLTADDLIQGALFVDFGTVEESIEISSENFRVAPGLGLRVHLPWAGLGAPLSFDFAFPIANAEGDDEKIFSFFIGAVR